MSNRTQISDEPSNNPRAAPAITLSQLEAQLWEAANILRGSVDATDFKTYVLPCLFFKRIAASANPLLEFVNTLF